MKSRIILILFLLVSQLPVFSADYSKDNYQKIISIDSGIYEILDFLILESGKPPLSAVKPYSEAEIMNIIAQIDREDLSKPGKSSYDEVIAMLDKTPVYAEDDFAADLSLTTSLELYLHTSDDESQWQYGYEERLPYFTLGAEVWFNEGFYAVLEPDLMESRFVIENIENNLFNWPKTWGDTNYHFPDRSFFSFGGENWNLQLGRDQLEYGNGETGKLMLSSYPDFYDFLKLKGFADNFAFTWTYINLESWSDDDSATRFISDHAIEVRLLDFITLYVNESALYYGEESQLQFFNPLTVYHNLFEHAFIADADGDRAGANIYMTLGFNLAPLPGLSLYGEFLLDEFQTFIEQAEYGDVVNSTPNATAFMLGTKGALPLGPGYLNGFFEWVQTSPWCYLLDPVGGKIAWTHRETTDVLNARAQVIKPIGYEYGPDAMAFEGALAYDIPGVFDAELSASYIIKGEHSIETAWTTADNAALLKTPTGVAENRLVIGLTGTYEVFTFLHTGIDLAWVNIKNYEHIEGSAFNDFQTAVSVIFEVDGLF